VIKSRTGCFKRHVVYMERRRETNIKFLPQNLKRSDVLEDHGV
jgi:hypothetical protein